jgi:hypothetical protein
MPEVFLTSTSQARCGSLAEMPRLKFLCWTMLGAILLASGCQRSQTDTGSATEWFSNITASSGLAFTHTAGTNYFMPDQVGSGVALLDYDNDDGWMFISCRVLERVRALAASSSIRRMMAPLKT